MRLYDSDFVSPYRPGRPILPLGSPIHVGVFVADADPTFVLVLDDCFFSQTSNPNDPVQHFLIRQGYDVSLLEAEYERSKRMCDDTNDSV